MTSTNVYPRVEQEIAIQERKNLIASLTKKKELGALSQPLLKRVDEKELGLVEQTSVFIVKDKFKLIKDGGMFIDLPEILFNKDYFDSTIVDSPPNQFGEYDSIENLQDYQMNYFAINNGFGVNLDLSQVHSLCFGARNNTYDTLNQESIPYIIPIKTKQGEMFFRIMCYKEGFLPFVEQASNTKWYRAKFIARYQILQDPIDKIRYPRN